MARIRQTMVTGEVLYSDDGGKTWQTERPVVGTWSPEPGSGLPEIDLGGKKAFLYPDGKLRGK